ncbi:MAG: MBL fold metallo-hydrolase [Flavobacteriales bacterium]|nr:MBL fold metallo-hydrolase [Flavobacteriales bacterium]
MKVTFLGTGTSQGVPVIACDCDVCLSDDPKDARLRTSVMLEINDKVFVIDTGPDFRQQMLNHKVNNLTAVLFTHEHKDHVAGLDDVRAFNFKLKKDVDVYATGRVQEALKREFHYVFSGVQYPGIPRIELHDLPMTPFKIEGVEFRPFIVYHHKLPVVGFRIGDFTYITDANRIPDESKEVIEGTKTLVLNALRKEDHISHFNLDQAIEVVKEFEPDEAYFVHMSHYIGKHVDVESDLDSNIHLAYDGLQIVV